MGGLRKEIDFEEEDVCWWVWWVFRCVAMRCFAVHLPWVCWLAVGLIEEEMVEEGREEKAKYHESSASAESKPKRST
nr:hypothetical protein CFP56_35785 [Quercus suber]